jgi:transposase
MDDGQLPTDIAKLQALLRQSREETRQRAQALQVAERQVTELSATVEEQRGKLEAKQQQILELLRALRGKQRERLDPDQLLLFEIGELESLLEESEEEAKPTSARNGKRKRGRRMIPEDLPHEERIYELPEEERLCPHDGQPMPRIRWEESKQLEYEPATLKVIVHKRAVYACPAKHDEAKLVTAPKPPQPIEKGLAGPGLLAQMVVSKFGDHLPGYRLEDILSRHNVEIRRSTIYDWLASMAELVTPLIELMKQRVLESNVIHTDDTQVKLIDKSLRSTRLARFWAYIGDANHPYTVYDFTETRQRAGPQQFLAGYEGYLQADAYGGYDGIYVESGDSIKEVACWAHCRRYWWKSREHDAARAHHVLAVIGRLYEIERAATKRETGDREANTNVRQSLRTEHAAPLLAELKAWLDEETFLPKSQIGKAATYTRNQWTALNRYVEDGKLSIDNNEAERAMRTVAIGRKNWLFVGSPLAGARAANLISLVASCKANRVEPWAYLRDIFTELPLGTDPHELLPDRWLVRNPTCRWNIADRRENERKKKLA